jgi:anti-anti-sigma factor
MATTLTLDTTRAGDGTVALIAAGEIDLSNVEKFSKALASAIAENGNGTTLTVDLTAVEYLDSAAINVLFPHADQLHLVVHPLLTRVFSISGLDQLTTIEPAPAKK